MGKTVFGWCVWYDIWVALQKLKEKSGPVTTAHIIRKKVFCRVSSLDVKNTGNNLIFEFLTVFWHSFGTLRRRFSRAKNREMNWDGSINKKIWRNFQIFHQCPRATFSTHKTARGSEHRTSFIFINPVLK